MHLNQNNSACQRNHISKANLYNYLEGNDQLLAKNGLLTFSKNSFMFFLKAVFFFFFFLIDKQQPIV